MEREWEEECLLHWLLEGWTLLVSVRLPLRWSLTLSKPQYLSEGNGCYVLSVDVREKFGTMMSAEQRNKSLPFTAAERTAAAKPLQPIQCVRNS